jgi:hypothetical protein
VAWRILAWVYRESNVVATEAAAKRVAMIASAFPKYEGIQYESAVAWRILTWAYRQSNVVATEAAAERAAAIASAFPKYENIQYESALAWQNLVGSAVKSNDEVRVAFALGRLDDLCHERDGAMVWKGQPVSRRVLVERERARDMVKQWRQMRNGDLDPEANQE